MRYSPLALAAGLMVSSPALFGADARPNVLVCVADDWGFPHAGCYGDPIVKTPNFDKLARDGMLFTHAFCAAPSCTPSRGAMLTGQHVHRLAEGGNLWSVLPQRFATYPDLLAQAGYTVGLTGKGWGPGTLEGSGRDQNPAGPNVRSFDQFLKTVPADKPFCYWFGSRHPHRAYPPGSGQKAGLTPEAVKVPPTLPDTPEVRGDILDYYAAVQQFDEQLGEVLGQLEASGRAANTLVIVTSDNGWPFPRGKANLYDAGTRQPLAVRWPGQVRPGQRSDALVSLTAVAPTVLEAAGVPVPNGLTGRSLLPLLRGNATDWPEFVVTERERHANVRRGDLSYPCRAMRAKQFHYIRNLRPDRWPAGDPETYFAVGPFGDIDGGPAKQLLLDRRDDPSINRFFQLACAKRPAEELYDLAKDPHQLVNVADKPEYAGDLQKLRAALDRWMADTGDPRTNPSDDRWDKYRYFGNPVNPRRPR